jgi:hypothetical protein
MQGQNLPSSDTAVCRKRPCKHEQKRCFSSYTGCHASRYAKWHAAQTGRQAHSLFTAIIQMQPISQHSLRTRGAQVLTVFRVGFVAFQVIVDSSSTCSSKRAAVTSHTSPEDRLTQEPPGDILNWWCASAPSQSRQTRALFVAIAGVKNSSSRHYRRNLPGQCPQVWYTRRHPDHRRGPRSGTLLRRSCSWQV